ncbi:PEP/pyruvate-binding domain-containing protein [Phenylobacterium sp.]|uniref:PEP/pyruvate-binding domain-containing protein n=1 Tax=Phenylobacterium sp. TaxID=1871053 RepID=UPI002F421682
MAHAPYLTTPWHPSSTDEGVVGGKARSLVAMKRLGFDVPDFCVVTCRAFDDLAGRGGLDALRGPLSDFLAARGPEVAYAVRSSARGEDSAENSFAGLYSTFLDVHGPDAVLGAIEACWTSYNNPEARDYRETRGAAASAMAVIVQALVPAEWSGVSFAANPVSLALSETVINASPGLGEALVSGAITPEEIVLDAESGEVLRRKNPPGSQQLPDGLLRAVLAKTRALSEAFGFPQDVEWASVGEQVFLLQSRPITTIADVYYSRCIEPWKDDPNARPDDEGRLWSRAYADEIWTPPVSPLFYNIHNLTSSITSYMGWHGDPTPLPPDVFKYYRAAAYVDVDVLRRQYSYHPKFSRLAGILNFFPESLQAAVRNDPWRWAGRLRRTARFELAHRSLRSLRHNHAALAAMWPGFIKQSDGWFDVDLDALSLEQVKEHRTELNKVVSVVSPACGFAVAYHAHDLTFILTGLLEKWFGDGDALYAQATSGLDQSVTVAESEGLWRLAKLLRSTPPQVRAAARTGFDGFERLAKAASEGRIFLEVFDTFWKAHRHRGASYKDVIHPRWGDDKGQLLSLIAGFVDSDVLSPRALNEEMAELRRRTQRELLARCRGPALWRRPILKWLFRYNEIYMSERDNHRFYFDRVWYQLRRIYRTFGRRLAEDGVLEGPDDVFFLGAGEVELGLSGALDSAAVKARVQTRRRAWERTLRSQPPKFLAGYASHDCRASSDAEVLVGIGASPGRVTGPVRVVYDVRELSNVADGEILVTRQTDPAWSTVFARIGGLVLETGGVLAHGASLCREFDLPCVTAIDDATSLLRDGDLVTVDGRSGRVSVDRAKLVLEIGPLGSERGRRTC